MFINTSLGTWDHSNGDSRFGEVSKRTYYDDIGNSYSYEICTFNFDQLSLAGSLEVVITGDASLEIKVSQDSHIGVPLFLNGANGGSETLETPALAVLMEEK